MSKNKMGSVVCMWYLLGAFASSFVIHPDTKPSPKSRVVKTHMSMVLQTPPELEPHPPNTLPPESRFQNIDDILEIEEGDDDTKPQTQNKTTSTKKKETVFYGLSTASPQLQQQYDALIEEMWEQEQVIQTLRHKVFQKEAVLKSQTEILDSLQKQRMPLLESLENWTQQVFQLRQTEAQTEKDHKARIKSYAEQQSELEEQVGGLQKELVSLHQKLRTEKQRYAKLTQRMQEVDGTQEWEEENFQLEKERLLEDFKLQQELLENVTAQFEQETQVSRKQQKDLQRQINQTLEESRNMQSKLMNQRQEHLAQRLALQDDIQEQQELVKTAQKELDDMQSNHTGLRKKFQSALQKCQEDYQKLQDEMEQGTARHAKEEEDLEFRLAQTNRTYDLLTYQLRNEETQFKWEMDFLQEKLQLVSPRAKIAQQKLEKEQSRREKLRQEWLVAKGRKEKRTETTSLSMRRRFVQLRQALTKSLRASRETAQEAQVSLKKRYESNLDEIRAVIDLMNETLTVAQTSRNELQELIDDVKHKTDFLRRTTADTDVRLTQQLAQMKVTISELKQEEAQLEARLQQKDKAVQEMERSWRAIWRASWKLTKQRARSLGRRTGIRVPWRRRGRERKEDLEERTRLSSPVPFDCKQISVNQPLVQEEVLDWQ